MTPAPLLADEVERTILSIIEQKQFGVGDTVCTELELAELLGVSRNLVREAVARLRGMGIVEKRRNRGIILCQPVPGDVLRKTMPYFAASRRGLSELLDVRYALEMGAVSLAIRRATDADVATLKRGAERYRRSALAARGPRKSDHWDVLFHCAILDATHSDLLRDMHQVVYEFFAQAPSEDNWRSLDKRSAREHLVIARAFERRDADKARRALEEHLRFLLERYGLDRDDRKKGSHDDAEA